MSDIVSECQSEFSKLFVKNRRLFSLLDKFSTFGKKIAANIVKKRVFDYFLSKHIEFLRRFCGDFAAIF